MIPLETFTSDNADLNTMLLLNGAKDRNKFLIETLRKINIKACHPNDGWVERDKNGNPYEVKLLNPEFNDNPQVGEKIALSSFYEPHIELINIFYCIGCNEDPYLINDDKFIYLLSPTDESYLFYGNNGPLIKQSVTKNKKFSLKKFLHNIFTLYIK